MSLRRILFAFVSATYKDAATQSDTYATHATYAMFAIRTEKIYPFIDNVTDLTDRCMLRTELNCHKLDSH
jgi:hypothetical protein